jgi:hypothetical protein
MSRVWRCFFCDEVFKRREDAAEHFGRDDACEADVPACKLAAHEGHLVHYIRKLEGELRRHLAEDTDLHRSIMALEAEHGIALQRAEEEGYARGLRDARLEARAGIEPALRAFAEPCLTTRPPRHWLGLSDLNRRPALSESAALPTELSPTKI